MARKPSRRGWGEGSVREIGPGRWLARAPAGVVGGKRVRPSKVLASRADAVAWLREQLAKRDRGCLVPGGVVTLAEWYAEWIAVVRANRETETARKYAGHFTHHILPTLGTVRLRSLTAEHARQ